MNAPVISEKLENELLTLMLAGEWDKAMVRLGEATRMDEISSTRWVKLRMLSDDFKARRLAGVVARCRYCGAILKTALAKQCLACGINWHDPTKLKRNGPRRL